MAEKLVPKSSHQKKERPSKKKRQLPAGLKLNKSKTGKIKPLVLQIPKLEPHKPDIDLAQEREKPRLEALLFCLYGSLDTAGQANLMGCFDRLYVSPETKETGAFFLFSRTAGTKLGRIIVSILDPGGDVVGNVFYEADAAKIPKSGPYHVQFMDRIAFRIKKTGIYWFDVSYEGISLGGTALSIELQKPQEAKG